MDQMIILIIWGMGFSAVALYGYQKEVKRFGNKKDYWVFHVQEGLTSFTGFIKFILTFIGVLTALPAGIIWRISKWMNKSSRN
jgi:hypothetical protein